MRKVKFNIACIAALVLFLSPVLKINAAQMADDGILNYELTESSGELTASVIGIKEGIDTKRFINIPSAITKGGKKYTVTEIGEGAFRSEVITGVKFNEGLEKIGKSAFHNANELMGDIRFPSTLTTIDDLAFYGCSKIESVVVPDTVTTLYENAFRNCESLKEVERVKLASASVDIPEIVNEEMTASGSKEHESYVDSSVGEIHLSKGSSWIDEKRTKAEITINYGAPIEGSKLDVLFVLDYSGSMNAIANVNAGGVDYSYSRLLMQQDILNDAIDSLIGANDKGHDIRVGVTAFSHVSMFDSTQVSADSGFSKDAEKIKNVYRNVNSVGNTYFNVGLKSAYDMFSGREDTSRVPVVIFLGDGQPYPRDDETNPEICKGLDEAQMLRDIGAAVYPIGIYLGDSQKEKAGNAMKAISHDKSTFYDGCNTESYIEALTTVIGEITTTLNVQVRDTLSEWFKTEDIANIEASAGTVELNGKEITWNLAGEAKGVVHTLKIQAELDEVYSHEDKPTNSSLSVPGNGIEAENQPELYREEASFNALKEVDKDKADAGEVLTYKIKVKNKGVLPQAAATVIDYIPKGTTVIQSSISDKGIVIFNKNREGYIFWELKNLLPGEERMVSFSVVIDDNTSQKEVKNQAIVNEKEKTNEVITEINIMPPKEIVKEDPPENSGNDTTEVTTKETTKDTTKEISEVTSDSSKSTSGKSVKTGDNSNILKYIIILTLGLFSIITVIIKKYKKFAPK